MGVKAHDDADYCEEIRVFIAGVCRNTLHGIMVVQATVG